MKQHNSKRKNVDDDEEDSGKKTHLKHGVKRAIIGILIIAFAAISVLSLLQLAGIWGAYLSDILGSLFGLARWLFPVFLLLIGYQLLTSDNIPRLNLFIIFGCVILLFSLTAALHIIRFEEPLNWRFLDLSSGGGYLSLALAIPLYQFLGKIAALVILAALMLISLLLIINISIQELGQKGFLCVGLIARLPFCNWKPKSETGMTTLEKGEDEEEDEAKDVLPIDTSNATDGREIEGDALVFKKTKLFSETLAQDSMKVRAKRRKKIDIPLDLLNSKVSRPTSLDIKNTALKIQKTLENFEIPVELGETNVGPTVTQFTIKPADGIKLSRITALDDDLALALAAHPVRIEAPIPGKSFVGIEVPNQTTAVVNLREVLSSEEFIKNRGDLTIALGKDVAGKPWTAELSSMPHLLIAGATGSGKTICINSIIVSLLYQYSPDDLKFILIDPKRVELTLYNGTPHLLSPAITDIKKTVNALKWCILEMERRFEIFSQFHKRDIHSYNRDMANKMPYIVLIIDELADLMATSGNEVEGAIIRLAQMARAVGIHLILATQRPSVDVITGLIKANITARIAFSVASIVDSRTILDASGAEKLLGRGDMLFIQSQLSRPVRLQGVFVSEEEVKRVVEYLKEKYEEPEYDDAITQTNTGGSTVFLTEDDDDVLYERAKEVVIQSGRASASLLQRRLKVGYARAARLLDMLEENGVVGPGEGAKPREVLIDNFRGNDMMGGSNREYEDEKEDADLAPSDEEQEKL